MNYSAILETGTVIHSFSNIHKTPDILFIFKITEILQYNNIDLIVLDMILPEIDGLTLYNKFSLFDDFKRIPTIALSGYENESLSRKIF